MNKPILVLDFDGVLHSYSSGWAGATIIPDSPVPGAAEFCHRALEHFELWIVSSRCYEDDGIDAITKWLDKYQFPEDITVSGKKPPAFLILDDRAITFTGTWPDVDSLLQFKPWNKR